MKINTSMITIVLLLSTNYLYAEIASSSGSYSSDTKNKACEEALLLAKKDALHQSGVNIFTNLLSVETSSNIDSNLVVKKNLQSSYGELKVSNKVESLSFDDSTGLITCNVDAVFDVDTSKLKYQMLALSQKYNNQHKLALLQSDALDKRKHLLQKYDDLKDEIKLDREFEYSGEVVCSDDTSPKECKRKFKEVINQEIKQKFADYHSVDQNLLTMSEIKLLDNIMVKFENVLVVSYSGLVVTKGLSIKNPYISELIGLGVVISEDQLQFEDESDGDYDLLDDSDSSKIDNKILSKDFSKFSDFFTNRVYEVVITDMERFDSLYTWSDQFNPLVGNGNGSKSFNEGSITQLDFYAQYRPGLFIKYGVGQVNVRNKTVEDGFGPDNSVEGHDNEYNYDYQLIGLALQDVKPKKGNMRLMLELDMIIPNEGTNSYSDTMLPSYGATKLVSGPTIKKEKLSPFFNLSVGFGIPFDTVIANISLSFSSHESMKDQVITLKLGKIFH